MTGSSAVLSPTSVLAGATTHGARGTRVATVIRTSKSLGRRFGSLLTGALSAALSVFLIVNDFVDGVLTGCIALLPLIFALGMVAAALRSDGFGSCPCPRCGTLLTNTGMGRC